MTYIPDALRRQVIERASGLCEYCLIPQGYSLFPHEIDHIIPEKHRGKTTEDNLCLSCMECNRYKGTDFASFDPETEEIVRLFHPRQDRWQDHFRFEDARIIPVSPVGEVTVFVLALNEEYRVQARIELLIAGLYPPEFLD